MRYLRWLGVATGLLMAGLAIMVFADLGTAIETKVVSATTINLNLPFAVMAPASGIALVVVSLAMFRGSKDSD